MLRWAPYPFVRIALSFIAGILLFILSGKEFRYNPELFAFFFSGFILAFILARRFKAAELTSIAGVLGLLCFMAAGSWVTELRTEYFKPDHLLNIKNAPTHYAGVVDDFVVQKPGYHSSVLRLQQVRVNGKWQKASGNIQISVPHDSEQEYELSYGDNLLIKGAPQLLPAPANPRQFDYRQYLNNKNIYHRHSLREFQFQKIGAEPQNYLLYISIKLRRKLDNLLRENIVPKREYGISSALILGVKDDLDNSIRNVYAQTGTMHVLAVSGLHVGLIYGVLMLFLGRLGSTQRRRQLTAILVLAVLWLYAIMTGLSPSVLRAVVMFSLVTIAGAVQRQHNIYNTLAIAAFGLLFYNPYFLFDVGFQLSFLAVLGIVYLQPKIYNWFEVNNWLGDKLWALLAVSLAAQLITLPLGLLYFHQFPLYFWVANMVVVPLSTLVLYTGLASITFAWLPLIGKLLFMMHTWIIWGMNEFNIALTKLPLAIINGIDISITQALLLYGLMFALILFFALKKLRYFTIATGLVAILALQEILETISQSSQQKLSVYSLRNASAFSFLQGQQAILVGNQELQHDDNTLTYNILPQLWYHGVAQPRFIPFGSAASNQEAISHELLPDSNSLYVWRNKSILVLSKPLKIQPKTELNVEYVLLKDNAKVWPEQLQAFRFRQLILDASNSPWYRKRLKELLSNSNLPVYDVAEKGAFVADF
ncbi:ComEC/Rec2 family competence protein [Pontibacter vulgaris]|uniref:ComEC/Rec2 family competence protein n=1 Tax=Pontibacter vulgaris TaxID=2905679 RepID=UPI001FA77B99|nr:ComEC/Rec2 family competence protein [Pontibacter vulgaris]